MRSRSKTWVMAFLAGCVAAIGPGPADHDAAAADRKPVVITRIFTGPDGLGTR